MEFPNNRSLEEQIRSLVQARDRLVIEVHRHDGAIAVLSALLQAEQHKEEHQRNVAAVSQFPMAVNSTTTQ